MSNEELQDAFNRCKESGTAEEWEALALAYLSRGYVLNAGYCFKQSATVRFVVMEEVNA